MKLPIPAGLLDFVRMLLEETLALLTLGAFLVTVAAWAAIFIWGW